MDTKQNQVVLGMLQAISKGELIATPYRAVLGGGDLGPTITIEQPFRDGASWCPVGTWYLETLQNGPVDGLSIDYGQQWAIKSGMLAAIAAAEKHINAAAEDYEDGAGDEWEGTGTPNRAIKKPLCECGNTQFWKRNRAIYEEHTLDLGNSPDWQCERSNDDGNIAYECGECGEAANEEAEDILGDL